MKHDKSLGISGITADFFKVLFFIWRGLLGEGGGRGGGGGEGGRGGWGQ